MNSRNDVEVMINGKRYTLRGYESGEYLQKIASYINNKCSELKLQDTYSNLDTDMRNILLAINLADDYYKMQKQVDELEAATEIKDKEIFDMKHELIALQTKLESVEGKLADAKENYDKLQKENIRLEVELGQHEKNGKESGGGNTTKSSNHNRKK